MNAIEIARRLGELKQVKDAQAAYSMALQKESLTPEEELEAASYIFFSKGDYKIAFTTFVSLFNRGEFQAEILDVMSQAFYFPNLKTMQKQYEKNCKALSKYPYFFRQEFPPFEDLPIWFFPFDNQGFVPYYPAETRFGDYINFEDPMIDRYFFRDLEKPVLAENVYSQYQLEYLNDNVRKSEWVARENHIYLHYTDWMNFCAYLQVLNFKKILQDAKFVFLIEDEISRYPIDFKQEYGIDYSQYPVKPYGVREFHRMIWHTQLSAHNGGDFFNEVFYGHPNLLALESILFETIEDLIDTSKKAFKKGMVLQDFEGMHLEELNRLTDKDVVVALYLKAADKHGQLNPSARIVPAIFFQPHFYTLHYQLRFEEKFGGYVMESSEVDKLCHSQIFKQFKYIKTFTPMRRPTTSYAATIRFMLAVHNLETPDAAMPDELSWRMVNRSFMVDPESRLFHDSRLVRFEDGKLNSKATFTALAKFLDIPYTESMTYCSGEDGLNPDADGWNVTGFNPESVYRTYDDFCDDADRALLEYTYRDVYAKYGYDFHYYHGEAVDNAWIETHVNGAVTLNHLLREVMESCLRIRLTEQGTAEDEIEKTVQEECDTMAKDAHENRVNIVKTFQNEVRLINPDGRPLQFMTPLELDPELLEEPLYR